MRRRTGDTQQDLYTTIFEGTPSLSIQYDLCSYLFDYYFKFNIFYCLLFSEARPT